MEDVAGDDLKPCERSQAVVVAIVKAGLIPQFEIAYPTVPVVSVVPSRQGADVGSPRARGGRVARRASLSTPVDTADPMMTGACRPCGRHTQGQERIDTVS